MHKYDWQVHAGEGTPTWGTPPSARRWLGVSSCSPPKCGWSRRAPVRPWWNSTTPADAQTSPSRPPSTRVRVLRSPGSPAQSVQACCDVGVPSVQLSTGVRLDSPRWCARLWGIPPLSCHWWWREKFWSWRETLSPPAGSRGHCPPSPVSLQPERRQTKSIAAFMYH